MLKLAPFIALLLALSSYPSISVGSETPENVEKIRCANAFRLPSDPRWFDLESAIDGLDFSRPIQTISTKDIESLNAQNLNLAIQSRLKVLVNIFDRSDEAEAARLFLAKFDQLGHLPKRYANRELIDRGELRDLLAEAKGNISTVYDEAFLLTLLSVANRQPFLVLADVRIIPRLAEEFFMEPVDLFLSPLIPKKGSLLGFAADIRRRIDLEKSRLLGSSKLQLSARSKRGADVWRDQFEFFSNEAYPDENVLTDLAKNLRIDFELPKRNESNGLSGIWP